MLIFGFGPGRAKDEGPVVATRCPNCGNDVMLHHLVAKKSLRLYFVPVLPYGTEEYLLCPICSRGTKISTEEVQAVTEMKAATAAHRAGVLVGERYEAEVERFWRRLGLG